MHREYHEWHVLGRDNDILEQIPLCVHHIKNKQFLLLGQLLLMVD